ncbi:MAG: hypothetical protein AAGI69_28550 [Cyanobacteria bacterium P01_H01_bin.21]
MSKQTISEELFERFCKENKIQLSRIEVSTIPGKKKPDYEIATSLKTVLIESFQGEKVKHYAIADKVPGQFQEWKEIGG